MRRGTLASRKEDNKKGGRDGPINYCDGEWEKMYKRIFNDLFSTSNKKSERKNDERKLSELFFLSPALRIFYGGS